MWLMVTTTFLFFFISAFYLYVRYKFNYFRSLGVAQDPGFFPLGSWSTWKLFTGKIALTKVPEHCYHAFPDDKFVGTYAQFGQPVLIVKDLELMKKILIKDFDHFVDRRPIPLSQKSDKYFTNVVALLSGERWKVMRSIISPVFTSGKLKSMMHHIHRVGDELVEHLNSHTGQTNAKSLMMNYTLDVITRCVLGIEGTSFGDTESELRKQVAKLTGEGDASYWRAFKMMLIIMAPGLANALNIPFFEKEPTEYITDIIRSALERRMEDQVRRNDLMDIVLDQLQSLKDPEEEQKMNEEQEDSDNLRIFDQGVSVKYKASVVFSPEEIPEVLISNVLMLFLAGVEPASSGLALVCYHLAKNPEAQDKLYAEIRSAIDANGGNQKLEYYSVQSLPYLHKVILESLRTHALTLMERQCVKDYPIQGSGFTIPKGMLVQLAAPQLMMDHRHFSHPERFDPDRFGSDVNQYAYLAFGQGPRQCLGVRFALLQMKIAIIRLITNFTLLPCAETVDSLIPDPMSISLMPKGGVWISIQTRPL